MGAYLIKVQVRRDGLVLHGQDSLDEACHPGRIFGMSNIGFYRAHPQGMFGRT